MDRKVLHAAFMEIVDNQLESNDPPETKQTLKRLMKEGWNRTNAKKLIAQCVIVEIFETQKFDKPFDMKRFVKNLNNLPTRPFDD